MTFEALATILVLAVIVEFATEIFKSIFPGIRGHYSKFVAILMGIILCVTTQNGFLASFNINMMFPLIDYVLTGLIISRGSNIIHDIIARLDLAKLKG